jgi:DNA-binding IscR family transcriptional regulator
VPVKPDEINLAIIVRHFEETIALLYSVSEKAYQPCKFCKNEPDCTIRHVFKDIREYSFNLLSRTTLKDLIEKPVNQNPIPEI